MKIPEARISAGDIARLAGVKPPAVSNWRQRYAQTFPQSEWHDGQELFPATEVAKWLDRRKIAKNDLKAGELAGVTYGARFRQNLGMPTTPTNATQAALWQALEKYRGAADIRPYADLVLGLLYLSGSDRARWADLAIAAESRQRRSEIAPLLEQAMEAHGLPIAHSRRMTPAESGDDERLAATVRVLDGIRRSVQMGHSQPPTEWAAQAYEYLLARFAAAEGKYGAEFFTPPSVVRTLVESVALAPGDSVHDPCCNSGGVLVAAARLMATRTEGRSDLSLSGQALMERSWRLARMNLELNGVDADLGRLPGVALRENLWKSQRFDVIMMNPPFNMSGWSTGDLARDQQWRYGPPPEHNANFAWLQHAVLSLAEGGRAAVVMANGAASSENAQEKTIRAAMVEAGVVEGLVALPSHLFFSTAVPVTIWLLRQPTGAKANEVLFIDATTLGSMVDRIQRILRTDDILQISAACEKWRGRDKPGGYEEITGFSASVSVQKLREHDYRLSPRAYITVPVDVATTAGTTLRLRRALDELDARSVEIDAMAVHQLSRIDTWTP
jgi:type I restriction enzyme M protein